MPHSGLEKIATRGIIRAELLCASWETFSALLFGSAILPAALATPWPGVIFFGSLLVSAVLLPFFVRAGRVGVIGASLIRVPVWPIAAMTLSIDYRIFVAAVAFGAMAWAQRRAIYRRELWRFDPAKDGYSAELVRQRLGESAMVAGILGGHLMLLFSVAFLRAESKVIFRGWWQLVPMLGLLATIVFTVMMRTLSGPVTRALVAGKRGERTLMLIGLDRARRLPGMLATLNFGIWIVCTTAGVFYFRTGPAAWATADAVMQLAYATLFSWGVSFYQRGWDRDTLAPVAQKLASWADLANEHVMFQRSTDAPPLPLRERMLRDFGGPLIFTAVLSLLSSIGLYRTLGHEVSLREDLNAILALFAAFLMLVLAVGGVVARVARNLSLPLTLVAEAAELVASGKLDAKVAEVPGPSEVQGLAKSVERMRENLARTIAELEHERASLEANVEARTAELKRAMAELKGAQAALVQGERLASIGELVAGVAHEIYNPLNAVAGSTEPLERVSADVRTMLDAYRVAEASLPTEQRREIEALRAKLDLDASLDDLIGISSLVRRATNRTVRIVQNLRNFARGASEAHPTDLHAGLEETLVLLGSRLRLGCIQLTKSYGDLPKVVCRAGELNQVFMNLVMNSIQALEGPPRSPSLTGTSADSTELREIHIETRVERNMAVVAVSDNGPGVPEDIEHRIFDPFFTTKPPGQGTGLGLSISTDIIHKHGGTLTVERPETGGARLVVRIPLGGNLGAAQHGLEGTHGPPPGRASQTGENRDSMTPSSTSRL